MTVKAIGVGFIFLIVGPAFFQVSIQGAELIGWAFVFAGLLGIAGGLASLSN